MLAAASCDSRFAEQPRDLRAFDDRLRRQDRVGLRQALHAGGDVDRLAEIILPVVEHHREARTLVEPDVEREILAAALSLILRIASRIRMAARSARSGVGKVAITASPMVLTTAPPSAATAASSAPKWLRTRSKAARSPTRS